MMIDEKNEILKTYDKKGRFLHYVDRKTVHDELLPHNEIALWIINPTNKCVLLEKRSASKRLNPSKWSLCAGHVIGDDSLATALRKEAYEELGISIDNYHPIKIARVIRNEYCNYSFFHHYCIVADVDIRDLTLQQEEVEDVAYFDYYQLKNRIKNGDETFALIWNDTYKTVMDKIDKIIGAL